MARMSGEQRRPQIVAAALKLIAEQGLGGFTTRSLAQEVGLAEGTIFRHFESKEDIIGAAIDHLEQLLDEDLAYAREGNSVQRLGRFFRRRIELISQNPGLVRILFSDELARAGAASDLDRIQHLKQRGREFISARIHEADLAGLLRQGLSPDFAPIIVHGTALALLFSTSDRPAGSLSAKALWETLEALIFRRAG
jgi:AcrR family transcriptional regulator